MKSRIRSGIIRRFDKTNWWGEIELSATERLAFHATCFLGVTSTSLPIPGQPVDVIFSDATHTRLLSVRPKEVL